MSALFGKPPEKTILLVDIENGSVATAFVRLSREGNAPKLFGERRVLLPHKPSRDATSLATAIERAAHEALESAALVAARIRAHPAAAPIGQVEMAALFFAPPWASPHFSGRDEFVRPIAGPVQSAVEAHFGGIPLSLLSMASAVAHGAKMLLPEDNCLVCTLTAEIAELLLLEGGAVRGRATVPVGHRVLARTLAAHGGLSSAEAHSALKLPGERAREALFAAGEHFAEHFAQAAEELFVQTQVSAPEYVYVLGPEDEAQLLARALGESPRVGTLFESGVVRALPTRHATPHVAAHGSRPDLLLLVEALFADWRFNV